MDKGFVIIAENTNDIDYIKCAVALAKSIKRVMPRASVTLLTDAQHSDPLCDIFDHVVLLDSTDTHPNDLFKLSNDFQVYNKSPYEYTIKLEADMYIPQSIDFWWDALKDRDVVVSTTARNFKQEITDINAYRRFIVDNNLPNCYNGITYFRKSDTAKQFYETVRTIFENWKEFRSILKCNVDEKATTDWVYALACHMMGVENTTLPYAEFMSMVHMKQFINGLPTEDWTDTLVYEILPHTLRVNTIPQMYPFHYHIKSFADKVLENTK